MTLLELLQLRVRQRARRAIRFQLHQLVRLEIAHGATTLGLARRPVALVVVPGRVAHHCVFARFGRATETTRRSRGEREARGRGRVRSRARRRGFSARQIRDAAETSASAEPGDRGARGGEAREDAAGDAQQSHPGRGGGGMHVSASGSAIAANLAPTRMEGTARSRAPFSQASRQSDSHAACGLKSKTGVFSLGREKRKKHFCRKIGVQRSSVSHVLSGRNKPSLDFILKINKSIENISLDWLFNDISHLTEPPTPIAKIKTSNNDEIESDVEKIVIFYKDGSCKIYKN